MPSSACKKEESRPVDGVEPEDGTPAHVDVGRSARGRVAKPRRDEGDDLVPPALRADDPRFFNDTATTEIYTLSLHDALPISGYGRAVAQAQHQVKEVVELIERN